jgi:hypothetical protein
MFTFGFLKFFEPFHSWFHVQITKSGLPSLSIGKAFTPIVSLASAGKPASAMDAFKDDVRSFFKLPIPRFVWEHTKQGRDPLFVRFVEECTAQKG